MQSEWYFWQVVVPIGIGTFLIRCSFIFLGNRVQIPPVVRELFTYIPAAVLPALAIPMVFFHQGVVASIQGRERLMAFIIATIICLFSRNVLVTIISGLCILYSLQMDIL